MTPREVVASLIARGMRVVFWPAVGDQKGPKEEGWTRRHYAIDDYKDGDRVGVMTGTELSEGKFLHDVDIDWAPGAHIAMAHLPRTDFVYGRASKRVSHCFYTLPEPLKKIEYKDPVDGTTLIEIRGTKADGELGFQSMAPPSIWSKDGKSEPLEFRSDGTPAHLAETKHLTQRVTLGAIGMLLAKHLGHNGFGHDARLAWAGFLLRASLSVDEVVAMGEAMSVYCNNREVVDVRQVVASTAAALDAGDKKVKGGPALAKVIGGEAGKKVVAQVNVWLGRDSDFIRTPDGLIVKDNQENIKRAIAMLGYELSYQEFAEKTLVAEHEKPPRPLDDRTLNNIWLRIDREHRFRPSFVFYEKVITDHAYDTVVHPVRTYLSNLRWDGEGRINHWLAAYGGAEETSEGSESQTYLEAISSIVLIAAVRRILHPGCKYDEMLVLESEQGFNKSTALRSLCPCDEWFSDDLPLNVEAKEVIERTVGKWVIEASELIGRKSDQDHLKSMLSRQVDGPARMAYARIPVERRRQFIVIGTTNNKEYLGDPTGSRRFWPCTVGRFDVDGIIRDRDQLWAEAVVREAAGESIRLPEHLWPVAGEHQEQRREVDAWEEVLEQHVATVDYGTTYQKVSADALWLAVGTPVERRDRSGARRISEIMQRMGFERTTIRDNGTIMKGYSRRVTEKMDTRTDLQRDIDSALGPSGAARMQRLRDAGDM